MLTCYYKNYDTLKIAETTGESIIWNGSIQNILKYILILFKYLYDEKLYVHIVGIGNFVNCIAVYVNSI